MNKFMPRRGYLRIGLLVVLALGLVGGVAAFLWLGGKNKAAAGTEHRGEAAPVEEETSIAVKAVHPRYGKTFTMSVRRPADVVPYYTSELKSEVPGKVATVIKTIGSRVKENDILVKLDVPDLVQLVKEKTSAVTEAENAFKFAKANARTAAAAVKTARKIVSLKEKTVEMAGHTVWYREKLLNRLRRMSRDNSVEQAVVDEAERNTRAAKTEQEVAGLEVEKATLEVEDAKAKLEAAEANAEVKKSLIQVAKDDLAYAEAKREFGNIKAPFDGVIIRRNVDKGSFVQNASNGQQATPLMTVIRDDIVTISMRLPDKYAPFINAGTEAVLETDALPGVKIHGKITRFAPSVVNSQHDRTMPVEVELWNGSGEAYRQFAAKMKQEFEACKKENRPFEALKEGSYDPKTGELLVCLPTVEGKKVEWKAKKDGKPTPGQTPGQAPQLISGTFARMTLVLKQFDSVYLLPTSAIVSQGGYPYIYVVRGGKAHLQPVKIQIDDGKLYKVELLNDERDVIGDLTGKEEVIITGQGELSEGAPVKATVLDDWSKVVPESK